jgi:predicted kinase
LAGFHTGAGKETFFKGELQEEKMISNATRRKSRAEMMQSEARGLQ